MICQKYIARCYRVYQHERNENASFLSIFNGRAGGQNGDFQTFLDFEKTRALWELLIVFSNSLKALFGQNIKKLEILKLSPDSRYLQKLALKSSPCHDCLKYLPSLYEFPVVNELVRGFNGLRFSSNSCSTNPVSLFTDWTAQKTLSVSLLLERFSFAFTANGKRQAVACRKRKKIMLF